MSEVKIPYAPHSPGAKVCTDGESCYFILDGSELDGLPDDDVKNIRDAMRTEASRILEFDAEFLHGVWACDFFCGSVMIVYYGRMKKQQEEEQDGQPDKQHEQ